MKYMRIFSVFPIILLVLLAAGFFVTQPENALTMDINPSIEIVTNRLDLVVRINPLNKDAEILLKDFKPKDKRLEKTINELLDLMILTGYIHGERDNFVMLTVDQSVDSKLIDKVNSAIAVTFKNKEIAATVLKQSIPKADKEANLTGVQLATQRILDMDKSLNPNSFASMTVEQLIQFSYANNIPVENLFTLIEAATVTTNDIDIDTIETAAITAIDTTTAEASAILSATTTAESTTIIATTTNTASTESTTAPIAITDFDEILYRMSAVDARHVIISKFGGIIVKIEYAYDENNPHYKGQVLIDGSKVVFELNARTNKFTKLDIGLDNAWNSFSEVLPTLITMNQAANLVISKSGLANTFVQKIDFKWDDTDPLYQGEAFNKGVKYAFEIYAFNGDFKKWEISSGDQTWNEQYFNVK